RARRSHCGHVCYGFWDSRGVLEMAVSVRQEKIREYFPKPLLLFQQDLCLGRVVQSWRNSCVTGLGWEWRDHTPQPLGTWTFEGIRGSRLLLQAVEEVGCQRDPNKDDQPDTSSEKIVVVEESTPGTLRHIMPKQEFKGDSHPKPHQTNSDGLPC